MSDSEEESETSYFGTPLDPYAEDAFPKKRPITVEEQVAKDAQGRRRFHGAFTGGFSAGFYNTVGSLEGWAPTEFKSSRGDKAQNKLQKPEDFMDDEDVGEFGIAPQTVRATDDYSSSKKRKKKTFSNGPIPGEPVLETLIQAGNETVGYFLMKNMNKKHRTVAEKSGPKVYGCVMPKDLPTDETLDHPEHHLHEVYKQSLAAPKSNTFGLGYVGLDKTHVNLFQPSNLTVHERNNKKLSISGQAFGVGAFEDEDEDIYVKDDMSRYDFEMSAESANKDKKTPSQKKEGLVLDIFVLSKSMSIAKDNFPPPVIPSSFSGKHNVKKSRFEPVPEETTERRGIDAALRAKYLGEDHAEKKYTPSNQQHKQLSTTAEQTKSDKNHSETKNIPLENNVTEKDKSSSSSGLLFDRFVSAKQDDDPTNMLEAVKPSEMDHGTKEMHAAVKLKMFGPLTRVSLSWQPNSLLCKRFNVPEPHSGELNAQKNKKRTKNLIFEYQKHAENDPSLHKPGLSVQTSDAPSQPQINENEITIKSDLPEQSNTTDTHSTPEASTSSKDQELQAPTEGIEVASEKIIDITERVDVSKNTDLFKAVFLSSSESESESEAAEDEDEKKRKEQMTANVLSEPLVPKIKPTKEGILSNIDFSKFRSSKGEGVSDERKSETESRSVDLPVDDNVYGPKLPTKVTSVDAVPVREAVVNSDEWVEKGFVEKQKKHKKKHKKEKDKDKHRKKHKHKSKK